MLFKILTYLIIQSWRWASSSSQNKLIFAESQIFFAKYAPPTAPTKVPTGSTTAPIAEPIEIPVPTAIESVTTFCAAVLKSVLSSAK